MQDLAVEKQQRGQRLVLRPHGDLPIGRQPGKEGLDLLLRHLGGMALAIGEDKAPYPAEVRLFGTQAVVLYSQAFAPDRATGPVDMLLHRPARGCISYAYVLAG